MMRSHSILAPSAAHRWITCTPSARLEEGIESSSRYADEGTLAHSLGEAMLRNSGKLTVRRLAKFKCDELYAPEMLEEVTKYVSYVLSKVTSGSMLIVEQRLDMSFLAPAQGGTADSIVITGNVLDITDLKYGKGVRVDAENNPQQMLYAAAALSMFDVLYDINTVRICIHQPRLNHVSEWEISADNLKRWVAEVAIPAAVKAYAGEGETVAGDHCKFCKVKAKCRAFAAHATDMLKFEFKPVHELTDAELSEVLHRVDALKEWASSAETYVRSKLLSGKKFTGFKLVEGRSVRKFVKPLEFQEKCHALGFTPDKYLDVKLKGLTELEKIHGKAYFAELAGPYLDRAAGTPTVVPESDPRPEYAVVEFATTEDII